MSVYHWRRYSAAESFQRLQQGEDPWVALGDFLDDWCRSRPADRFELVAEPLAAAVSLEQQHWAALFAAAVEQLCTQEEFPLPAWVNAPSYVLPEPWYPEASTENLRRLQAAATPEIFKQHNVFGGADILQRV